MTRSSISVKAVDQAEVVVPFYMRLEGEERLPRVLGTGRNAVVFLATNRDRDSPATVYHAIKFLRDDVDKQYARAAAYRFFEEAEKAQQFHQQQEAFVTYFGWGAIDRPQPIAKLSEKRDFWWDEQFVTFRDELLEANAANADELERIRTHYSLQGPFYVLQLCQGTLYDLLDKSTPWIDLPAYSIERYHKSLQAEAEQVVSDVEHVRRLYMLSQVQGRSGYDILNSFDPQNDEANRIRSLAVLQIFSQVVRAVDQLHGNGGRNNGAAASSASDSLAHRDLKPGNIFFQHEASAQELQNVRVQLSDLGYVTTALQIQTGEMTLKEGKKGIEYQAPGSQYYRAPEQAEMPVEVRLDVLTNQRNRVRVRGSKINRIEIHDWLLLSDVFTDNVRSDRSDTNLFKITQVQVDNDALGAYHELLLDRPIDTSRSEDVQGQIIRATGFHSDGFSLGAILYDMISGGKDPEQFYIYCIVSLIGQLAPGTYSIDDIMYVLAPEQEKEEQQRETLNLGELQQMLPALLDAMNLDQLFERLQQIAFSRMTFSERPKLTVSDKRQIGMKVLQASDIDSLVISLIRSPLFTASLMRTLPEAMTENNVNLAERLKNYRFRAFDQVHGLLRDKRKVVIPRDILRIIVACMVRDAEGSYYKRDREKGYTSDSNVRGVSQMRRDVEGLMGDAQFRLPDTGFPARLQKDILFKLRSLAFSSQVPLSHEPSIVS